MLIQENLQILQQQNSWDSSQQHIQQYLESTTIQQQKPKRESKDKNQWKILFTFLQKLFVKINPDKSFTSQDKALAKKYQEELKKLSKNAHLYQNTKSKALQEIYSSQHFSSEEKIKARKIEQEIQEIIKFELKSSEIFDIIDDIIKENNKMYSLRDKIIASENKQDLINIIKQSQTFQKAQNFILKEKITSKKQFLKSIKTQPQSIKDFIFGSLHILIEKKYYYDRLKSIYGGEKDILDNIDRLKKFLRECEGYPFPYVEERIEKSQKQNDYNHDSNKKQQQKKREEIKEFHNEETKEAYEKDSYYKQMPNLNNNGLNYSQQSSQLYDLNNMHAMQGQPIKQQQKMLEMLDEEHSEFYSMKYCPKQSMDQISQFLNLNNDNNNNYQYNLNSGSKINISQQRKLSLDEEFQDDLSQFNFSSSNKNQNQQSNNNLDIEEQSLLFKQIEGKIKQVIQDQKKNINSINIKIEIGQIDLQNSNNNINTNNFGNNQMVQSGKQNYLNVSVQDQQQQKVQNQDLEMILLSNKINKNDIQKNKNKNETFKNLQTNKQQQKQQQKQNPTNIVNSNFSQNDIFDQNQTYNNLFNNDQYYNDQQKLQQEISQPMCSFQFNNNIVNENENNNDFDQLQQETNNEDLQLFKNSNFESNKQYNEQEECIPQSINLCLDEIEIDEPSNKSEENSLLSQMQKSTEDLEFNEQNIELNEKQDTNLDTHRQGSMFNYNENY